MLIIALTGRKLMVRLGFFARHAKRAQGFRRAHHPVGRLHRLRRKHRGAVHAQESIEAPRGELVLQEGLDQPYAAPEFAGIEAWQNSAPLTMKELQGKVVLIDFWTYSCINCVRTLPYLTDWDRNTATWAGDCRRAFA